MNDGQVEPPSTREYLSLVFLNRVSLAGAGVVVAGVAVLLLWPTRTGAAVGAVLSMVGFGLFGVGFTLAQRRLSGETQWGH